MESNKQKTMDCSESRQFLLNTDWNANERGQALASLHHLDDCRRCREALEEFDAVRGAFSTENEEALASDDVWNPVQHCLQKNSVARRNYRWPRFGLQVAASILIGTLAFEAGRFMSARRGPVASVANKMIASPALFTPPELSREVNAFRRVSKVFDGRAGWMLVSRNDSDVGVVEDNQSVPSNKVVILRLTVTRGQKVDSEADLLVRAGQKADLTLPLAGDQSLHYRIRTSVDDPTCLTVWLELQHAGSSEPVAVLATTVRIEEGQSLTAGQLKNSGGDFELRLAFAQASLPEGAS